MLLCLLLISMFATDPLSKQSIMQLTLHQLKLSFLLSDVALTKQPIFQGYQKSSSSLTLSMQWDQYLTLLSTLSKFTWLPFPKNLGKFSPWTVTTWLSFGNILADVTGLSSKLLTVIPNGSTKFQYFLANHHRTWAKKKSMTTLFTTGKWCSRL